jgi:N-alpha-acetyltransferase 50
MFETVLEQVKKDKSVKYIYLHIQVGNETAMGFYKKYGFEVSETLKGYYTDIEPSDCHILKLNLE